MNQAPIFHNKENEKATTTDGKEVFLSRSAAICAPVMALDKDFNMYVLLSRRGTGTPDFQGHLNLVCGYLDHDETLVQAAKRELWEEVGLNVDDISDHNVVYDINQKPWSVDSNPTGRQNVTVRFGLVLQYDTVSEFPELSTENCEPNEVEEAIWVKHEDVLDILKSDSSADPQKEMIWAFNHYKVYREWVKEIEKSVQLRKVTKMHHLKVGFSKMMSFVNKSKNKTNFPMLANKKVEEKVEEKVVESESEHVSVVEPEKTTDKKEEVKHTTTA